MARDNYCVILKGDGDEVEAWLDQHGAAWRWGINTVIPMRAWGTQGEAPRGLWSGGKSGLPPTGAGHAPVSS